jgi:hypothetical protein
VVYKRAKSGCFQFDSSLLVQLSFLRHGFWRILCVIMSGYEWQ